MDALVQQRKCRLTGSYVSILDADKSADFDAAEGGRWITYCDRHETFCQHSTLADARWHAADPTTWCGLCCEGMD